MQQDDAEPCERKEVWWDGVVMHTSNLLGKGNYGSVVSVQSSDGNEFAAKFYKAGQ